MPIYAYRCQDCGFEKDQLQKLSEAPLTECPSCGGQGFARKLTAPAFQLKGSGWYVTDFRDGGQKKAGGEGDGAQGAGNPAAGSATESTGQGGAEAGSAAAPAKSDGSAATPSESGTAKPANAPATPAAGTGASARNPASPSSSGAAA
jgi:putative FmdB family regulatory protein